MTWFEGLNDPVLSRFVGYFLGMVAIAITKSKLHALNIGFMLAIYFLVDGLSMLLAVISVWFLTLVISIFQEADNED